MRTLIQLLAKKINFSSQMSTLVDARVVGVINMTRNG